MMDPLTEVLMSIGVASLLGIALNLVWSSLSLSLSFPVSLCAGLNLVLTARTRALPGVRCV